MAATNTNMLIVKMIYGKDIRRFTASAVSLNWSTISKRFAEVFGFADKKFKICYVDDEGDKITLSSDEELLEAVNLALSGSPAVLRLTVHLVDKAEGKPAATTDVELTSFVETMAKQLPAALRNMISHIEPDFPATLAANLGEDAYIHPHEPRLMSVRELKAALAARGIDTTGLFEKHELVECLEQSVGSSKPAEDTPARARQARAPTTTEGVHEGVTCDKSGTCPIVGNRYHLVGHNYDLCEAEYEKLTEKEKALYEKIPPPSAETAKDAWGFHPGVSCDRSGMTPILGMRYKLRGHNYDLCEAEFSKLNEAEKANYDAIPPPVIKGPWRRGCGRMPGKGMGMGMGMAMAMAMSGKGTGGKGCGKGGGKGDDKLAARFISDVAVFDGTQVAPGTTFIKIWKLKNTGEVPWPAGTRMLFVSGDQMTTEMSVPIGRDSPVMPGEEVDIAVEITAPSDLGRYLGYWRLTGPHCRRKWGQRVWCHVQVVDPSQPAGMVDVEGAVAELEKMKAKLPAEDGETVGDEPVSTPMATDKPAGGNSSDEDTVLVTDKMVVEAQPMADVATPTPPPASPPPAPPLGGADLVKASLKAMGFLDDTMIETALAKHGEDLDACATALAAVSEWDSLLDDLAEMGFEDRELNKTLMLKNDGNIKRTVKDLIEA